MTEKHAACIPKQFLSITLSTDKPQSMCINYVLHGSFLAVKISILGYLWAVRTVIQLQSMLDSVTLVELFLRTTCREAHCVLEKVKGHKGAVKWHCSELKPGHDDWSGTGTLMSTLTLWAIRII